jgi:hypothetical protein
MKSYASYAEWKKDQSSRNRRLIGALERIVEEAAPRWTKTVKWGQGCFAEDGVHKAYLHTEEDQVQLGSTPVRSSTIRANSWWARASTSATSKCARRATWTPTRSPP